MLKTNFIEQGRKVKETSGKLFYEPSSLLAFIRFNFLLRRTLIELMHADLIAIRSGLSQLDAAGVRIVDCQNFGLSSAEPSQRFVNLPTNGSSRFRRNIPSVPSTKPSKNSWLCAPTLNALLSASRRSPPRTSRHSASGASHRDAAPAASSARPAPDSQKQSEPHAALDFESCLEQIWEQLIATPPTRGRSMTTVKIGSARILMSSWEVTAFVSEDGPAAEDLRRAVVARALVTAAIEAAKETGNATGLDRALSVARIEVSRLQERVDVAKQAKDTEAAVNLGISTKRLLSALDEAEKLVTRNCPHRPHRLRNCRRKTRTPGWERVPFAKLQRTDPYR